MGILKSSRVNIVITNQRLRYIHQTNQSLESIDDHGEIELPVDTIGDGKIENHAVLLELVTLLVKEKKWRLVM